MALDRFTGYRGIEDNTPDRVRANARAAGAEDRVEVKVGDMREMPFEDSAFDGVVSVAAIDHLNREGVERTLAEVARVLRPNGQFLPFLHGHGYFGGRRILSAGVHTYQPRVSTSSRKVRNRRRSIF